jgi:hypothetical protein
MDDEICRLSLRDTSVNLRNNGHLLVLRHIAHARRRRSLAPDIYIRCERS